MIVLLALRNLLTNLKHTLIITGLVTLIITLFFIGNTVIEGATQGLRATYILNYTGDVVIQASSDTSMSLFGANTPAIDDFFSIPVLKGYPEIERLIGEMNEVESYTPQVSGPVIADAQGYRFGTIAFGIDAATYFEVFSGITLDRGSFLQPGELGAMISSERARTIAAAIGRPMEPGDPLLLTTAGETGFKIREVPLVGIYRYTNAGQVPNEITLLDAQTARALNSILLAPSREPDAPAPDPGAENIDDLFDDADSGVTSGDTGSISLTNLQKEMHQDQPETSISWLDGAWNFVVIRLKPGVWRGPFLERLNRALTPLGDDAVDWSTAAGPPALLVTLLFYLFNGGLILIIVAGVIAIVNVLLISVFQRIREIGTLRAIGAADHVIRIMFYTENLAISLLAGALGVLAGTTIIEIVNAMHISVSNNLLISMLGQATLRFPLSPQVALAGFLLAVILGVLSSLYPVRLALKIQPIEALTRG